MKRPGWPTSNSPSLPGADPGARSAASRAYLEGAVRADFDRWLDEGVARVSPPLSFREVRKGVQALSSLYVERREGRDLSARAVEGEGKRAALSTYYAPLHFLCAWHLFGDPEGAGASLAEPETLFDLGCGTGAAGAAVARRLPRAPRVIGIDRSGYALREARRTYAAFGVAGSTRRGRLPRALPKAREGDLWLFGYALNEFSDSDREDTLRALCEGLATGVRAIILEPLAGAATRWWPAWRRELEPLGVRFGTVKRSLARPEWIARLDRAAALDHRVLGARVAWGGPGLELEVRTPRGA